MTHPIVVRGDAARLPLPDASVDLIVTSPPYFALRSYTDGGQHYAGQIGTEPTPAAYIAALVECTREWMRVLKPSGSIFVNLGDKYAGSRMDGSSGWASAPLDHDAKKIKLTALAASQGVLRTSTTVPQKSLMLLPERYRIACVDQLGLIARAVIVWAKPNGLPESVTDRVRRSHEDWVHLTRSPRYFAAVDEIREPQTGTAHGGGISQTWASGKGVRHRSGTNEPASYNPLGKLPSSVWEVATEPLQVPVGVDTDHFAAYPSEWPRRLVLGWSPSGICTACDQGRRPVTVYGPPSYEVTRGVRPRSHGVDPGNSPLRDGSGGFPKREATITGYACACTPYTDHPETVQPSPLAPNDPDSMITVGPWREYHFDRWTPPPTRPSVCLDPFGGTGTTAHVAAALGRIGISVDLSLDYSRLAAHPELADRRRRKVLGLDKPVLPVIPEGQLGFDWEDVS